MAILFIECDVRHSIRRAAPCAHTHMPTCPQITHQMDCGFHSPRHYVESERFRFLFAVNSIESFYHNWSASDDPFSFTFHKEFKPACTRPASLCPWRRMEKLKISLISTFASSGDAFAWCTRSAWSRTSSKRISQFSADSIRFQLPDYHLMEATCCHPFPVSVCVCGTLRPKMKFLKI